MEPSLETKLAAAELMNALLTLIATNMAAQLALTDGGDITNVNAVLVRAVDDAPRTIPAEEMGIAIDRVDNAALSALCDRRQDTILLTIVEAALLAAGAGSGGDAPRH